MNQPNIYGKKENIEEHRQEVQKYVCNNGRKIEKIDVRFRSTYRTRGGNNGEILQEKIDIKAYEYARKYQKGIATKRK